MRMAFDEVVGMSRRHQILVAVACIFLANTSGVFGGVELPERYKKWIEEDARYIISHEDHDVFLHLKTDHERDVFIENFWKKLDSIPITPQNEFKEEHDARVAYVRDHYGINGDQGRIWILLGKPDRLVSRPVDNSFYSMEYWEYTRLNVPGLPPDLRLIFYKKWGFGNYVLYSPLFDGIRALLVNRQLDPDNRDVQKWLLANMDFDMRIASRSSSTGLSEFQSQDIIAKLFWNYGDLLARFRKNRVEAKIVFQGEETIPADIDLYPFPSDQDFFNLGIAVEVPPAGISFEKVKDHFVGRIDLYVTLLDSKGRTIDDGRDSLTMELTEAQLSTSKAFPLLYLTEFPVIPGNYSVEVLVRDFATTRIGKARRGIVIQKSDDSKMTASTPLLAYKLEQAGTDSKGLPFRYGGFTLFPKISGIFQKGSNLYFFSLLQAPKDLHEANTLPLRYEAVRGGQVVMGFEGSAQVQPGGAPTVLAEGFSTEKLLAGEYLFRISAVAPGGPVTLSEKPFTILEAPSTNGRFLFESAGKGEAERHAAIGTECLYAGRAADAATHFDLARNYAPGMTEAGINLARATILIGNPQKALQTIDGILKENPDNTDALMVRVQALNKLGRTQEAEQPLARLLTLGPSNTNILNYCADVYMTAGQREKALELFKKSIELDPEQPDVAAILKQ